MSQVLLTYEEALQVIRGQVHPLGRIVTLPLDKANGRVLAQQVNSYDPYPRFDNSSVDGYAIGSASDGKTGGRLRLVGSVAAGEDHEITIKAGSAVRILTGAPTPPNTYGVVMQEDVEVGDDHIVLRSEVEKGDFIRPKGSEFQSGQILAQAGVPIDAGVAALLAFAGCKSVQVFEPPRVTIVSTGDELVDIGEQPIGSQIRDTNSVMLGYQVLKTTGDFPHTLRVSDNRDLLVSTLTEVASKNDMILIAGGASVGDRDYVASAIAELGTIYFHGASIRPGKPILFGKIGDCFMFGLPGNPASAFVCFEIFAKEALRLLTGFSSPEPRWMTAWASFPHKAASRDDFVRVLLKGGEVTAAREQGSFGLSSLAEADGLARFPASEDTGVGYECPVLWIRDH